MITVKCPYCEAGIRGEDRFAGRVVACPKCKKQVQMPADARPVPSKVVLADAAPTAVPPPLAGNLSGQVHPAESIQSTSAVSRQERQAATTKPCPFCGEEILVAAKKCKHCGEFLEGSMVRNTTQTAKGDKSGESDKKILPLLILFWFSSFGLLGLHAFYAGNIKQGRSYLRGFVLWLISGLCLLVLCYIAANCSGAFGPLHILIVLIVWLLLLTRTVMSLFRDFISIVTGSYKDGNGRQISKWT